MTDHLSDEILERLQIDDLPDAAAAAARAHLAGCPACQSRRNDLQAKAQDFLDNVRRLARVAPGDETVEAGSDWEIKSDSGAGPTPMPAIPGYALTRRIGGGGQGVVYHAIQLSTKRKVAVKLLRNPGAASETSKERFRREVELIAQLKHPNIIAIFDSGVTVDGMPYYVMDYVRGQPLNHYVRDHTVTLHDALRIFGQVCQAVHFAHEKGVIHRDLKPSNILVTHDGHPIVLDFGLAKSLAAPSGPNVSLTHEVMGTLPYMAPEQVLSNAGQIDKRTDVYALGVVLYELLTGHYPYAVSDNLALAIKAITETPPAPPSRRWTPDTGISSGAAHRGTRRGTRCPIDKEMEAIVLKALSKERERRYKNAEDFAVDVSRYLAGDDIVARPPSLVYRIRQRVRRHRQGVIAWGVSGVVAMAALYAAFHYGAKARGMRRADELTRKAESLLDVQGAAKDADRGSGEAREQLDQIEMLLNEAIGASGDYANAYYRRGELNVLRALEAPVLNKPEHVEAALRDFEAAQVKAGGPSFDELLKRGDPQGGAAPGHPPALWEAIDLMALQGSTDLDRARKLLGVVQQSRPFDPSKQAQQFGRPIRLRDRGDEGGKQLGHSPEQAGSKPKEHAEITILFRDPVYLALNRGMSPTPYILNMVFDRLFLAKTDRSYDWNPAMLEEGPKRSAEDPRVWQLKLRKDLLWHDGRPVTAEDVAFSWRQVFRKEYPLIESVSASPDDPLSFSICFTGAYPSPECEMDFRILPRHLFADVLASRGTDELLTEKELSLQGRRPIGCGPFRVPENMPPLQPEKLDNLTLERFKDYRGPQPFLEKVHIQGSDDARKRASLIERGDVDVVELSFDEYRWTINGASFGHYRKILQPQAAYEYLLWTQPPEQSRFGAEIRQAVAYALDLETIRREDQDGIFEPFVGIWGGSGFGLKRPLPYDFDRENPEKNLKVAGDLLDQAGWKFAGRAFREKDGKPLQLTIALATGKTLSQSRVVTRIKQYLANPKVGIDLTIIEDVPSSGATSRASASASAAAPVIDLRYRSIIPDASPLRDRGRWTLTMPTQATNNSGYGSSREFGGPIEELFRTALASEPTARREILLKIQEKIYRDQPYLFLWQRPAMWLFREDIRGVQFGPTGPLGVYPGIRAWWVP